MQCLTFRISLESKMPTKIFCGEVAQASIDVATIDCFNYEFTFSIIFLINWLIISLS